MITWFTIGLAGATLLLLAIGLTWILCWANKALAVFVDPKVSALEKALPGVNCGACGHVGCHEYAEAIPKGDAVNKCPVGGTACAEALADIMGVEVKQTWPYRPAVHCGAKTSDRLQRNEYRGEQTCIGANLVAGFQGCTYGCMGLGDCVRSCAFDAIHIVDGLATVDYEKCTGCGACERVCPRHIISMIPFKTEQMFMVKCCNKDFGKDVKTVCKVGCFGCKLCARACPSLLTMVDNLPVFNYEKYDPAKDDLTPAIEKCPMNRLVWIGKPTEKDKAAVADKKVPGPEPKTTVDDAEWRG